MTFAEVKNNKSDALLHGVITFLTILFSDFGEMYSKECHIMLSRTGDGAAETNAVLRL